MKILLVNPHEPTIYYGAPPINLLMLAGYIMKFGHQVVIVDCVVEQKFEEMLTKFNPDIVGITGTTIVISQTYKLADYARSKGFKVMIGGIHATIFPEEAKQHADVVVVGEGELILKEILDNNLEGIVYGKPLEDLNEIPILPYHLINMEFYLNFKARIFTMCPQEFRVASLVTSKGCTHNCSFCHNSFRGLKYRSMSPEHICDELEFLIKNYKINAVFFIEDNMFQDQDRIRNLCYEMDRRNIKLFWGANSRVDSLDEKTLILARQTGLRQITFGWESGSQKMLNAYLKGVTVKQNEDSIKLCNKLDIFPNGTIMIGGPGETIEDVKKTVDFVVNNVIRGGIGVCVTTPLPGTKLWRDCEKKGLIPKDLKWVDLDFNHCIINMSEMSSEKVVKTVQQLRTLGGLCLNRIFLNEDIKLLKEYIGK